MVCWADCLGNCESKQSREHVVSENLWLSNTVMVQGFSWCPDAPKEIGITKLTAKILCRKHNSDLSPIDASAGDSFATRREVTRLKNVREGMKPTWWTVKKYHLDGRETDDHTFQLFVLFFLGRNARRLFPIGQEDAVQREPHPAPSFRGSLRQALQGSNSRADCAGADRDVGRMVVRGGNQRVYRVGTSVGAHGAATAHPAN